MPRLARPYIPLAVRVQVAERQLAEIGGWIGFERPLGARLKHDLELLFRGGPCELHHRPALVNRPFDEVTGKYTPDANDPDYLIYLPEDDHHIETRVRGVGALRSDLSERRYQKKIARNRAKREAATTQKRMESRKWTKGKGKKKPWPKRSFGGGGSIGMRQRKPSRRMRSNSVSSFRTGGMSWRN